MTPPLRQLENPAEVAPLRVVAVLDVDLHTIAERGIRFVHDEDDLGEVSWALLGVERYHVLVSRHQHAPEPGTEVLVPEVEAAPAALSALLRQLSLTSEAVVWLAPDIPEHAIVVT